MSKILITGASGRIGKEVIKNLDSFFSPWDNIILLKRNRPIDLEQVRGREVSIVQAVEDAKPYDFAFHLAGNSHTSKGHNPASYPEFARDNVELTERVCSVSERVLFTSTDNVFSGMDNRDYIETDTPNCVDNPYGKTKTLAERIVLENQGAVVRLQSVFGVSSNLIADRVIDSIEGRPVWPFWNDQVLRPALLDDILLVFKKIYKSDKKGIYHVSCSGEPLSRAEIARSILNVYREHDINIVKDYIEEEPCNNPLFPRRLVLNTYKTRKELGIDKFKGIEDAIRVHVLRIKKPELLA